MEGVQSQNFYFMVHPEVKVLYCIYNWTSNYSNYHKFKLKIIII